MVSLTSALTPASTDGPLRQALPLVAAALFLPAMSAVPVLSPHVGDAPAYGIATAALFAISVFGARRVSSRPSSPTPSASGAAIVGVVLAASAVIVVAARAWIDAVLHQPIDPMRADMLVVIREALHRLALGHDPYALYHVPWEAPLPYGPALWLPFAVPGAVGADLRIVTLVGMSFVPALLTAGGIVLALRRDVVPAVAALAIAALWVSNPDLGHFVTIGHTPVYWPLLAVLAWLIAEEQWTAAAVALGVLCVARSTMVAIVPVVLMAVWHRDRPAVGRVCLGIVVPIVLLFGPFAIWNWSTLKYGLYGSYEQVMKGFVWTQTDWARRTLGVTGFLLRARVPRLVEPAQAAAMLATYAAAWRALRRGAAAGGWMAIALLVFSMTTLWPVIYVYFDVALLLSAVALFALPPARRAMPPRVMAALVGSVTIALLIGMRLAAPPAFAIDVGTPEARRDLARGFSSDEREGDRTFAWVDGREAAIFVPRFSRRATTLALVVAPATVRGGPPQQMTAVLNGVTLGTRSLTAGWQEVRFDAPARALTAGVNELRLYFQSAISPREAGTGDDPRRLSAAIDRIYSSARLVPSS